MDWARAIAINQTALTRIVAGLIAMVGLAARLPQPTYRAVLAVLRPAEAAVRRLIVIAARGLVVKPQAVRPMAKGLKIAGKAGGRSSFQLFDTRKRFAPWRPKRIPDHKAPRIWSLADTPRHVRVYRPEDFGKPEPITDGSVDASRLNRRLAAIKQALETLPAQAKRLVRCQMRRKAKAKFTSPMRPGRPPAIARSRGTRSTMCSRNATRWPGTWSGKTRREPASCQPVNPPETMSTVKTGAPPRKR